LFFGEDVIVSIFASLATKKILRMLKWRYYY